VFSRQNIPGLHSIIGCPPFLSLMGSVMLGFSFLHKSPSRSTTRQTVRGSVPGLEALEHRLVPTLLGQSLFPADYPWNQNISNAPVAANSAAIISHIGATIHVHPDWGEDNAKLNGNAPLYGIPFNVVHGNSTTKINVIIDNYPGESDIVPVPIPAGAVIEGDFQNGPNPNGGGYNANQRGDSHLLVWDEDNNVAYELFGATRPSDPLLFPDTNGNENPHTDGRWHAAQESVWNMKTDNFRPLGNTSADAAGLSILAGLARPDEATPVSLGGQGVINHALRLTLARGDILPQYIYPGSHIVSGSIASNKLPFGGRLRLMNTPAINSIISGMGPQAQAVAHAMQQYGLVLADVGSSMYVTGASAAEDANNNNTFTWGDMSDALGLRNLSASDFQVVDLTPTVTGLSVAGSPVGSTITILGQNFSGAAGQLKVLFGNSLSPSVKFVDDGHITAVVPPGSGTVNIQVQSGVKETDPNGAGDNVTNPIFGYGISAVTPADQFTFGAPSLTQRFVTQIYLDLLGRAVDSLGLGYWTSQIDQGGVSRTAVVAAIEQSPEYRGDEVQKLYTLLLHRSADSAGLTAFVGQLENGATVESVAGQIAGSGEYFTNRGGGTNDGFLTALYQDELGRALDPSGKANWEQALANGTSRATVALTILGSQERRQDLVKSLYLQFLHRAVDPSGLANFVNFLNTGGSDEQVIAILVGSPEYLSHVP
jgi:hypothetical protein